LKLATNKNILTNASILAYFDNRYGLQIVRQNGDQQFNSAFQTIMLSCILVHFIIHMK